MRTDMTQKDLPILFPEDLLRSRLGEYWDDQMESGTDTDNIFPLGENMDSFTACVALLEVEIILGITDLPQTLVQQGGYKSKDEFTEQLTLSVKKHLSEGKDV